MSVRVNDRTDSKVQFVYNVSQIQEDMIRMCMNEKYFPKRYRFVLSNKLIDEASELSRLVISANAIFPRQESDLMLRRNKLLEARALIPCILDNLNLSYKLLSIPDGIIRDMTNKLTLEKKLIDGVIKKDKTQFVFK